MLLLRERLVTAANSISYPRGDFETKSALKIINKNESQKFTIARAVRWENVLVYCKAKHSLVIWQYFGRPDRRLIPQLGKNKNRKVVACTLQQFHKRDRDIETGTAEIYDSVLENLNILDVALAAKNYKVADLLFKAGIQPTEVFYHFSTENSAYKARVCNPYSVYSGPRRTRRRRPYGSCKGKKCCIC